MCCSDKNMHHSAFGCHEMPHAEHGHHGACGCAGGRKFLSRKERIEMLESYREDLKAELEGVEEALKELTRE